MSDHVKNDEYIFLCTNIRARETQLLTEERRAKMCEAASFDEAAKQLLDCGYPDMSGMDDTQLEQTIADHRERILRDIAAHCPESALLTAFRLRYDYHNIKVLVKSHGSAERLLSACGNVDPALMAECYRSESYEALPGYLGDALHEARTLLDRTGDAQRVDLRLDRAYYAQLLDMTQTLSDDFYSRYVRLCIDGANLRSAVRARRSGMDKSLVEAAMIPCGNVSESFVADASDDPQALAALFSTDIFQNVAALGAEAMGGGTLTAFESACENALTRWLDSAKYIMAGSAPVLAFLNALELESVAVRTVLLGKKNGMSAETIRERLRESYV